MIICLKERKTIVIVSRNDSCRTEKSSKRRKNDIIKIKLFANATSLSRIALTENLLLPVVMSGTGHIHTHTHTHLKT